MRQIEKIGKGVEKSRVAVDSVRPYQKHGNAGQNTRNVNENSHPILHFFGIQRQNKFGYYKRGNKRFYNIRYQKNKHVYDAVRKPFVPQNRREITEADESRIHAGNIVEKRQTQSPDGGNIHEYAQQNERRQNKRVTLPLFYEIIFCPRRKILQSVADRE